MDIDTFLETQTWLLLLPCHAMETLQQQFRFCSLLDDAFCCFEYENRMVVFNTENSTTAAADATMLQFQVLVSIDEVERKHPSALYFVFNGKCYLVNHTLLQKITTPFLPAGTASSSSSSKSAAAAQPPSARIYWPTGVQMRYWMDTRIVACSMAIQTLSSVADSMQQLLSGDLLDHHDIIKTERQKRRTKRRRIEKDDDPQPEQQKEMDDHINNLPMSSTKAVDSYSIYTHCFDSWMRFAETMADTFPPSPSVDAVCTSFLALDSHPNTTTAITSAEQSSRVRINGSSSSSSSSSSAGNVQAIPLNVTSNGSKAGASSSSSTAVRVPSSSSSVVVPPSTTDVTMNLASRYQTLAQLFNASALSNEEAARIERDFVQSTKDKEVSTYFSQFFLTV